MRSASVATLVLAAAMVLGAPPADAQQATSVTPRGATISGSASCTQGDIDIDYAAVAMTRTTARFTDEAGNVLDSYDTVPFQPDYDGVEHILLDAGPPVPDPGSIVGVHVMVGAEEPTADDSAGFFVAWRCGALSADDGGDDNQLLLSCVGPYGTVPQSVPDAMALIEMDDPPADCVVDPIPLEPVDPVPTTATTTPGPGPTPLPPRFTG